MHCDIQTLIWRSVDRSTEYDAGFWSEYEAIFPCPKTPAMMEHYMYSHIYKAATEVMW
jgi:hypothetical protein